MQALPAPVMVWPDRSGRRRVYGARFLRLWPLRTAALLCLMLLTIPSPHAETLQEIQSLAVAGAPELAVRLLQQQEPARKDDPAGWMRWENTLVRILAERGDWSKLYVHLTRLPPDLAPPVSTWQQTWLARTLVELNRGAEARVLLRRLLWSGQDPNGKETAEWRRLVIQSYRVEERSDDAYAAMLRYRQDYGTGGPEDALLSGKILLDQGRPADAVEALSGVDTPAARSLLLLARLRSKQWRPSKVLHASRMMLGDKSLAPDVRQQCEAVTAEAAAEAGNAAAQAIALEHLFAAARGVPFDHELFKLTPDALWNAYLTYAKYVGNRAQMLIGDDAPWWKAARGAGRMYPIRARSIYALLALDGATVQTRDKAHDDLVKQLMQADDGAELVRQLYLHSSRFPTVADVPDGVRLTLLDPVIEAGNLALASQLITGLDEPPAGVDRFVWRLRKAKIFVLGGDHTHAAAVLDVLVHEGAKLARPQLDQLIQVLFDLQTIGENDTAYELFAVLEQQVSIAEVKRELWYWMGDSRYAQQRYLEAAALYLRSATMPGPQAMDPWAQTARYQAARALGKAGLVADAKALYQQLLAATDDAERQAVLQRDLQQLLLVKQ